MKNKVLYVGNFLFPDLNAAANRVLGIGEILAELGYDVVFSGINETCREIDLGEDGLYRYKNFVYFPRVKTSSNDFYLRWDYVRKSAEMIGEKNIKYIISYHFPAVASLGLLKWCDQNDIRLIADCTEWYGRANHTLMFNLDSELRMRFIHAKIGHMIAISSYLEDYYNQKGCVTVRIPVVNTELAMLKPIQTGRTTNFCYSGNPSKKDLLPDIVNAFIKLYEKRQDFSFDVAGITKEEFMRRYKFETRLADIIDKFASFHGFIPQAEARHLVQSSDFSVLLRHDERIAQAGFPTKLAESMFLGTPMVANLTGDIGQFLQDGVNGFVVPGDSTELLIPVLERACDSTPEDRNRMVQGSVECANTKLYYRHYVDSMRAFLNRLETKTDQ